MDYITAAIEGAFLGATQYIKAIKTAVIVAVSLLVLLTIKDILKLLKR